MNDPLRNNSDKCTMRSETIAPQKSEQSFLGKLFERIKSAWTPRCSFPESASLEGRVAQNRAGDRAEISHLYDHLLRVAQKLEEHLDHELMLHVKCAMENITRDFLRIQKRVDLSQGDTEDKACNSWISKAKRWIELDSMQHDRGTIINALMKHHSAGLEERIDEDLRVIADYKSHSLANLPVPEKEREALFNDLQGQLRPFIDGLLQLKVKPKQLALHKMSKWKDKVDQRRSALFEKALHLIDEKVSESSLLKDVNDVEETPPELEALTYALEGLEKTTQELYDEIFASTTVSSHAVLKAKWVALQEEVHLLQGNLSLSTELFERLSVVQAELLLCQGRIYG